MFAFALKRVQRGSSRPSPVPPPPPFPLVAGIPSQCSAFLALTPFPTNASLWSSARRMSLSGGGGDATCRAASASAASRRARLRASASADSAASNATSSPRRAPEAACCSSSASAALWSISRIRSRTLRSFFSASASALRSALVPLSFGEEPREPLAAQRVSLGLGHVPDRLRAQVEELVQAQGGGDAEVEAVREPAEGEVDPEVGARKHRLGASDGFRAKDDGELLRNHRSSSHRGVGSPLASSRRFAQGVRGHRHGGLGEVRGPHDAPVFAQGGEARGGVGELSDGRELPGALREELVRVAPGLAVVPGALAPPPAPPERTRARGPGRPRVARGGGRDRVHEPDVLHAERLGGSDDGAVVVLVRASLGDDDDARGAPEDRRLRLTNQAVRKPGGVRVVRARRDRRRRHRARAGGRKCEGGGTRGGGACRVSIGSGSDLGSDEKERRSRTVKRGFTSPSHPPRRAFISSTGEGERAGCAVDEARGGRSARHFSPPRASHAPRTTFRVPHAPAREVRARDATAVRRAPDTPPPINPPPPRARRSMALPRSGT